MRRLLCSATLCAVALCLPGCPKEEEPAKDSKETKKEADKEAEEDDAGSLVVAEGDGGVDGPVPPDTSMVFFGVEGALYPLACFDKASGKSDKGCEKCSHGKSGDEEG